MKKDLFLGEVAEIYFLINNYLGLFPYLKAGDCPDVIHAQLTAIRSVDRNSIWQKVDAFSVTEHLEAIEKYVDEAGTRLASKFETLDTHDVGKMDMQLWLFCVIMLTDFTEDKNRFLQKAVSFFERHLDSFTGDQYWELLAHLVSKDMYEIAIQLSQKLNIAYDLPAHVIVQIYNAKYTEKHS